MDGLIEVKREAEHIVRLRFTGLVDDVDARRAATESIRAAGDGPYGILCETPQLKGLTPKARKAFATEFGEVPMVAIAMLGASLPTRALSTFVVAAINIIRPKRRLDIAFFDDETLALRWVGEMLAKRR